MIFEHFILMSILHGVEIAQDVPEEKNWSCETVNGPPCTGNRIMIQSVVREYPFINASVEIYCTDASKQKSKTVTWTSSVTTDDKIVMKSWCRDTSKFNPVHLRSTPFMEGFKLCIHDPKVHAITLTCRYLKDFEESSNEDASADSLNLKCGTIGAKQNTYMMDSGYGITKIDYNCEMIRIEKTMPETESTTNTVLTDDEETPPSNYLRQQYRLQQGIRTSKSTTNAVLTDNEKTPPFNYLRQQHRLQKRLQTSESTTNTVVTDDEETPPSNYLRQQHRLQQQLRTSESTTNTVLTDDEETPPSNYLRQKHRIQQRLRTSESTTNTVLTDDEETPPSNYLRQQHRFQQRLRASESTTNTVFTDDE